MNTTSPNRSVARRISRKMTIGLSVASALLVVAGGIAAPAMAHSGSSHVAPLTYGGGFGFPLPSKAAKTIAINGLVDGSNGQPLPGVTVLIFNSSKQGKAAVAATVSGAVTTPSSSSTPTTTPSGASSSAPASPSPSTSATTNPYWPFGLPPYWAPVYPVKTHTTPSYNCTVTLPRGTYLFVFLPANDSGLTPSYRKVSVGVSLFGKTSNVPTVKLTTTAPVTPSPSASASS